MLMQQAHSVKQEVTGQETPYVKNFRRPLFWDLRPVGFSFNAFHI